MKDPFEERLMQIAGGMEYPQTPRLHSSLPARMQPPDSTGYRVRKLVIATALTLVLLSTLMLVPPVRAAVLEFIQIGIVTIFNLTPGERITSGTPASQDQESETLVTATPGWRDEKGSILGELAGETTLQRAVDLLDYPIHLPTYPAELGDPDHVFVQEAEGSMLVLVWLSDLPSERVELSLHFIPEDSWAVEKFKPVVVQETSVNGGRAIWTEGPYPLVLRNGNVEMTRLIVGHVLIWTEAGITIRLETDSTLAEAIKIAESLQPYAIETPAQ